MNKIEPHTLTRLVWARAILKGSRLMLTLRGTETLGILPMKPVTVTQHPQPQVTKSQRCLLFMRYFLHAGCCSERDPVGCFPRPCGDGCVITFTEKTGKRKHRDGVTCTTDDLIVPNYPPSVMFYFWNLILDRVSTRSPGGPKVFYVDQASLKLIEMDLPLLPKH